jgi:hypothetical protein
MFVDLSDADAVRLVSKGVPSRHSRRTLHPNDID